MNEDLHRLESAAHDELGAARQILLAVVHNAIDLARHAAQIAALAPRHKYR